MHSQQTGEPEREQPIGALIPGMVIRRLQPLTPALILPPPGVAGGPPVGPVVPPPAPPIVPRPPATPP